MRSRAQRMGAVFAALGVLLGAVGLVAGPASAQTTSGDAVADEGSVASGTGAATNGSTASGSAVADDNSTASGDAVALDGSTASGCSTAVDGSTASGGPCPTSTVAPEKSEKSDKSDKKKAVTRRTSLARTGSATDTLTRAALAALVLGLVLVAVGGPARGRRADDASAAGA